MLPYFYSLDTDILSEEVKDFLIGQAFSNINNFVQYKDITNGLFDGNKYFKRFYHDEILKLEKSCTLNCFSVIILHEPEVKLLRHVDDPWKRDCVLSVPLYPKDEYPPTLFYKKIGTFKDWQSEDFKEDARCEFNNMLPSFLNTQQIHSVENTNRYRINYQLCFKDSFLKVVELYKNNQLFR